MLIISSMNLNSKQCDNWPKRLKPKKKKVSLRKRKMMNRTSVFTIANAIRKEGKDKEPNV
jgi:hypothetical protein